jgi:hypothetical protein
MVIHAADKAKHILIAIEADGCVKELEILSTIRAVLFGAEAD